MFVFVATLLVLIDSASQPTVIFLPSADTSRQLIRLTAAESRPGDVVARVVAIDSLRPSLPVSYYMIHDTAAFDIDHQSGCITLTSNTSSLTGMSLVNVTVRAHSTDYTGRSLTATTVVQFELVQSNVLLWNCEYQQARVTENSASGTTVATLTARHSLNTVISYHIVNGNTQNVFTINSITVSTRTHMRTCPSLRPSYLHPCRPSTVSDVSRMCQLSHM